MNYRKAPDEQQIAECTTCGKVWKWVVDAWRYVGGYHSDKKAKDPIKRGYRFPCLCESKSYNK